MAIILRYFTIQFFNAETGKLGHTFFGGHFYFDNNKNIYHLYQSKIRIIFRHFVDIFAKKDSILIIKKIGGHASVAFVALLT